MSKGTILGSNKLTCSESEFALSIKDEKFLMPSRCCCCFVASERRSESI